MWGYGSRGLLGSTLFWETNLDPIQNAINRNREKTQTLAAAHQAVMLCLDLCRSGLSFLEMNLHISAWGRFFHGSILGRVQHLGPVKTSRSKSQLFQFYTYNSGFSFSQVLRFSCHFNSLFGLTTFWIRLCFEAMQVSDRFSVGPSWVGSNIFGPMKTSTSKSRPILHFQ